MTDAVSTTVPSTDSSPRSVCDEREYHVPGGAESSPVLEPETSITDRMAVPIESDEPVIARTRVVTADSRTPLSSRRELRQPNRRTP
ncbi:hypothetical protein QA600_20985 [Natronococcus sp. A-GB1]|uniref:hypothetical protein n=1 Tax=Natronococcus sp. A-GB1 TaxID=3037648 RepID=UPI00241E8A3C|nr:hypothetical protein [Natronococcus sp. A-GB1]MDG5761801.1 hypothetical protein [Natronococcus sp. A-GB1]